MPVNALAQLPSASGKPPTTSICQSSIGVPRSQRFHLRERRSRSPGSMMPARSSARYAPESEPLYGASVMLTASGGVIERIR
jgi:hypothetical protein